MEEKTYPIAIDNLGSSGEGVGSLDGLRVFVDGALPGEKVNVQLVERKKRYGRGKLCSIQEASSDRVAAPCPLFERCGGCQLQHLCTDAQLKAKEQKVRDAMERIGGFKDLTILPCVPSPEQFSYRNKIQLQVARNSEGELILGLYARRSNDFIELNECLIHCPIGEQVYHHLSRLLKSCSIEPYNKGTGRGELRNVLIRSATAQGKALVVFITNGPAGPTLQQLAKDLLEQCSEVAGVVNNINRRRDNVILGRSSRLMEGDPAIEEEICGLRFKVSPASFFQVNTPQAEQLYRCAMEFLEFSDETRILDAYCGVGTMSLIFAQKAAEVLGIESVPEAIADAKRNAKSNGISNVSFRCARVEELIREVSDVDAAVLNPPRGGCELEVLRAIADSSCSRIVYVSCNPATLARDCAHLAEMGYRLIKLQPFDMFPQTMHVETVALLQH